MRRALITMLAGIFSSGAMPLDIYQGPLVAERSMDPNIVYIHDDSGSMGWDYMPQESPSGGNLRKSAFINKQYYNPDLTYQPPLKYVDGKLVSWGNMDQRCVWPIVLENGFSGLHGPGNCKPDKVDTTTADTTRRNAKVEANRGFNAELVRPEVDVSGNLTGRSTLGDFFASAVPNARATFDAICMNGNWPVNATSAQKNWQRTLTTVLNGVITTGDLLNRGVITIDETDLASTDASKVNAAVTATINAVGTVTSYATAQTDDHASTQGNCWATTTAAGADRIDTATWQAARDAYYLVINQPNANLVAAYNMADEEYKLSTDGSTTTLTKDSAVYYDYVPGYNSRIDNAAVYKWNPIVMINGKQKVDAPVGGVGDSDHVLGEGWSSADWAKAPENVDGNYETHAFKATSSNALFREGGANKVWRDATYNHWLVQNRACPVLFKDVPESRAYYHARVSPAADGAAFQGNPHAHCRYSYRTGDVDFPSNYEGFGSDTPWAGKSVGGINHARYWCNRTSRSGEGDFFTKGVDRTCVMGRHIIGDTNGGGAWTNGVGATGSNLSAQVSHYDPAVADIETMKKNAKIAANNAYNDGLAAHMVAIQNARAAYDAFCENQKWLTYPANDWRGRRDWPWNLNLPANANFALTGSQANGYGGAIPTGKMPLSDSDAAAYGKWRDGGTNDSNNHLSREWCFAANTQWLAPGGNPNPTYRTEPPRKTLAQFNQAVADYKAAVNALNAKLVKAYADANAIKASIDQSLEHRVSTFVDDSGALVTEHQPRARTAREEIRNFANWYSYYRTRHLAAKSGLSLAFARLINRDDTTQPSQEMHGKSIRLGYDTINQMPMGRGSNVGPGARTGSIAMIGRGPVPFMDFPNDAKTADGAKHPYAGQKFVQDFYAWVSALPVRGGTPLRSALNTVGQYYMNSDKAWLEYPPTKYPDASAPGGGGEVFGCRRSFTILMTDGYYGDGTQSPADYDVDGRVGPEIWRTDINNTALKGDKYRYQYPGGDSKKPFAERARPFFGENSGVGNGNNPVSGSLADIAMYYWNRDLRPSIPNMITPTKKDPAFWQHMQTFTIGLGVQGRMSDAEVNQFLAKGTNKNILWTYPSGLDTDYERIDDLMHAGLNGHAGTAAAEDAGEFAGKLAGLLAEISGQAGSNTSPAAPRGLDENSIVVTSSYDPSDWSGEVYGNNVCMKGVAQCGSKYAATTGEAWNAGALLADRIKDKGHLDRKIFTHNGSWAVPFTTGNLSDAIKRAINVKLEHYAGPENCIMARPNSGDNGDPCLLHKGQTDQTAYSVEHLINYLRGEQKYEDSTTGTTVNYNGFRRRSYTDSDGFQQVKLLGDIVNSSPTLITAENFNWDQAKALNGAKDPVTNKNAADLYKERLALSFKKNASGNWVVNRNNVDESVLVGAGDGMLHSFNAMTGEENFAFIPQAVHPILKKLGDPQYALIPTLAHSFYVDGATVTQDVLLGGQWKHVAISSTGRSDGGHSYFAINVEKPSAFSKDDVLWEFTDRNLGAPANGKAAIALVDEGSVVDANGNKSAPDLKWYALFGNGYNSKDGVARLFLVDLATGSLARSIEATDSRVVDSMKPNGLGTPSLVGNGDGTSILAYAGDLQGNLWKFDLKKGKVYPLLKATNPAGESQIITAAPRVTLTGGDKIQVTVGTGKFLSQADVDTTDVQTIYSVRDQCGTGDPVCEPPLAKRGALYPITWKNNGKLATAAARDSNGNESIQQGWVMESFSAQQQTALKDGSTQGFYLDLTAEGMAGARVIDKSTEGLSGMGAGNILVPVVLPVSNPCGSSDSGISVELDPNGGAPKKSQLYKTTEGMNVFRFGEGQTQQISGGSGATDGAIGGNDTEIGGPVAGSLGRGKDGGICIWVGATDPKTGDPIIDEKTGQQRLECVEPIKPGKKKGRQSWRQLR